MNNLMKRGFALLLVLVLCVSMIPAVSFSASAAESYIYNWGERGEVATTLSDNAEAFYFENGTSYEELSALSGGTYSGNSTTTAPQSALYKALQKLMVDNHDYTNGYDANNDLLKYTDCQNGGGKISSFYSGTLIGPGWGEGGSWNKEHTWPNSKGLGGKDEDDIMMIRPTATSENSGRGNTAYGKSGGYYNPNSESGGQYDLRGDVARIFLYVYVRWGNTNGNGEYATWGSSGVMESIPVLLEWMESDPVDTWELGRNDSVESITGTRNVFVDYPEFAFLLFGEAIPANMITPSASGSNDCGHNNLDSGVVIAATCTANGYTLYTCQTSGCTYTKKDSVVKSTGHNYVSGTCSKCGETKPLEPVYVTEFTTGIPYKLGFYSTAKSATYYFTGTMSTSNSWYGASDASYENGVDVYVESVTGGYRLYFNNTSGQKQYINLTQNDTHYNFTYSSTATSVFTWDSAKYSFKTTVGSEVCYIGNYGTYVNYGTLVASKSQDTDYYARLYTYGTQGGNTGGGNSGTDTPAPCTHSYYEVVTLPTCTAKGFTTYTCSLCSNTYTDNETPAKGHRYQDGTCTACGATQSTGGATVTGSATIDFADVSNRTSWDANQQTWEEGGVKLVNDKAASESNVADYSNPARFYAASAITITAPGNITKIVFECSSATYASTLQASIGNAATASSTTVTVTLNGTSNTFNVAKLTAQVRATSVTVTYGSDGPATECTHNVVVDPAVAATCTSKGYTEGKYCSLCNEIIVAQQEIPALNHHWIAATTEAPKTCDRCGLTEGEKLPGGNSGTDTPAPCTHSYYEVVTLPTCTAKGYTTYTCSLCSDTYTSDETPAKGHRYQDGTCTACGATQSTGGTTVTGSVTIDFADVSNRTSQDENQQTWEEGGVKLVNDKAASASPVADYKDPARFYKGSAITITAPGNITKIVFECSTAEYATVLAASIGNDATANDTTVTVTLGGTSNTFTIAQLTAQVRATSVTVTYGSDGPATECNHNVVVDPAVAPTCTSKGYTEGKYCSLCNEVIEAQEELPMLAHHWIGATCTTPKTCGECGLTDGAALGHDWNDESKTCDRCGATEDSDLPGDNTDSGEPSDKEEASAKDHSQCKANWFKTFWNNFINFFRKLFTGKKKCVCGEFIS